MPSSISSSSAMGAVGETIVHSGFVRLTASDRPGVAQPVPERDIPQRPWGPIWLGALIVSVLLLAAWEWHWRDFGAAPGYHNSDAQWVQQRRRIDNGEGGKTVLIGSSRVLFDVQLPVWEKFSGERPIQLALEGTSAVLAMEDLAADKNFTGRLLIGVTPNLFFTGFAYRGNVFPYFHKQPPSDRSGLWISQHLIEPWFAFYDSDFALDTVVRRLDWPERPGVPPRLQVRKLSVMEADRNTMMWQKVETDLAYRDIVRRTWAQNFTGPPPPALDTLEKRQKVFNTQIDRAVKAAATLRARGVKMVFVRLPSAGDFYAFEQKAIPRELTWEPLLKRTGVAGIHFEDHPEMQGYELPEWSHLSAVEAKRMTAVLAPMVERKFQAQDGAEINDRAAFTSTLDNLHSTQAAIPNPPRHRRE